MANLIQQLSTAQQVGSLDWLAAVNQQGRNNVLGFTQPGRKTEAWKYTSLRVLDDGRFLEQSNQASSDAAVWDSAHQIEGLDALKLVFVNGVYCADLSSELEGLPDGVELTPFSLATAEQQTSISCALNSAVVGEKHFFAVANSAQVNEGVYLKVRANTLLSTPIQILHLHSESEKQQSAVLRVLVDMGESSQATLIEQFAGGDGVANVFVNSLNEFLVGDNAKFDYYRLNLEAETVPHIGGVHANLGRCATFNSFYIALGSVLKRLDLVVNHRGEGAHCDMQGVYLPRNKQLVDFHTCIEHAVPHCTSNEIFRGIVADESKAVFNGRIHIHPDAQKTYAQLSNKNLLTSNKAEVDTKPELEIYADDVQCAHGATVAQLDSTALHYMQTRGVSAEEARVMLSFGFINELINDIRLAPVADYLRPIMARMFARDERLMRHIA
ncbi:Fe-S cluster assembly protein SufD [Teredinibacter turnerae]|uniref:Fe-S cluster assembly protein SufD n=1 Tax=Teredinibacter turnerae TaxID=2426 RepID=UPI00037C1F2C|nr:Fe-S cluster assembly protein SufD [Teredinibacter turnerae]